MNGPIRKLLALSLIASCGACARGLGPEHVIIVRPDGRGGVATELPHVFPVGPWTPTVYIILEPLETSDFCPNHCLYEIPSASGSALGISALQLDINNNCTTRRAECTVSVTGSPATKLLLNDDCRCLSVAVRSASMPVTSAVKTVLSGGSSTEFSATPFTTPGPFTVGP